MARRVGASRRADDRLIAGPRWPRLGLQEVEHQLIELL